MENNVFQNFPLVRMCVIKISNGLKRMLFGFVKSNCSSSVVLPYTYVASESTWKITIEFAIIYFH